MKLSKQESKRRYLLIHLGACPPERERMTSQAEQWSLIVCVIWPIMYCLMLAGLNYIDKHRGIDND